MPWHDTWGAMRAAGRARDWHTFAEVRDLLAADGLHLTRHAARQALAAAGLPDMESRYGAKRFTPAHVEAVRNFAAAAAAAQPEEV